MPLEQRFGPGLSFWCTNIPRSANSKSVRQAPMLGLRGFAGSILELPFWGTRCACGESPNVFFRCHLALLCPGTGRWQGELQELQTLNPQPLRSCGGMTEFDVCRLRWVVNCHVCTVTSHRVMLQLVVLHYSSSGFGFILRTLWTHCIPAGLRGC